MRFSRFSNFKISKTFYFYNQCLLTLLKIKVNRYVFYLSEQY